jgi:hypothetical protein
LIKSEGVPPADILEESVSLETVGNAYFARILHTDVMGARKIAVINNRWHIRRTKAVFEFVFSLPPVSGKAYALSFFEVEDGLPSDVLEARLAKEKIASPTFEAGGSWRSGMGTLQDMHHWVNQENTAYATKRLLTPRKPLDPELLKSY